MGEPRDTEAIVLDIVATQFHVDRQSLTRQTRFEDDLKADSLDFVELLTALEDEFESTLNENDANRIKMIGDLIDFLNPGDEGSAGSPARLKPPPYFDGGHAQP